MSICLISKKIPSSLAFSNCASASSADSAGGSETMLILFFWAACRAAMLLRFFWLLPSDDPFLSLFLLLPPTETESLELFPLPVECLSCVLVDDPTSVGADSERGLRVLDGVATRSCSNWAAVSESGSKLINVWRLRRDMFVEEKCCLDLNADWRRSCNLDTRTGSACSSCYVDTDFHC